MESPTRVSGSEVGIYHFAVSYIQAAMTVERAALSTPHADSPIRFLYHHAIELFLKSYLSLNGKTDKELRDICHSITRAGKEAESLGLPIHDVDKEIFGLIDRDGNNINSRYIVVGFFHIASICALHETARHLCIEVNEALAVAGKKVRADLADIPHHPSYEQKLKQEALDAFLNAHGGDE